MITFKQGGALLLLALLSLPSRAEAVPAPFEIDVKELDRQEAEAPKPAKKKKKEKERETKKPRDGKKGPGAPAKREARQSAGSSEYLRYTVKPGDHIFKILMGPFGMSNEEAEALIPEVVRINNISNIRSLQVGSTLLIPRRGRQSAAPEVPKQRKTQAKKERARKRRVAEPPAAPAAGRPEAAAPSEPPPVTAEAPTAPAPQLPPPAPVWICSVKEREPALVVDSLLNALSLPWSKNRIIQSDKGEANAFSIKVDRYFEYKGGRYIVSIGDSDPYSYTLLRLLEGAGYRVLRVAAGEDFNAISAKLLDLMRVPTGYGRHPLQGGKEASGFLIQPEDAGGRGVLLTGDAVDQDQKWLLAPGCGAR